LSTTARYFLVGGVDKSSCEPRWLSEVSGLHSQLVVDKLAEMCVETCYTLLNHTCWQPYNYWLTRIRYKI